MEYLENKNGDIWYKKKNKLNQIMNLIIEKEPYDKFIYWNVVLWIGKNKDVYQYLKQTGKDGISSLIWAKECISHFINKVEHENKVNHLCVRWDDSKRKNVYIYGLKDLGFKLCRIEGKIVLCKSF